MPTSELLLDARIHQSIRDIYESLLKQGELLSKESLLSCHALFGDRFGPEQLLSLDGEKLLQTMHAHGSHDSLVYWLEFKSDEEFPSRKLGSIAGGSALKFRLYRRQETGEWMTGSSKKQVALSLSEAVTMARQHRDQLVASAAEVQKLPDGADDQDYSALQKRLDEVAPDVSRLGWGHKYLSLLYPDKLDDFHNELFQRHNLRRLLQHPPAQEGMYVSAGVFVRLAAQMGWPMNHLTSVLNERNGVPVKYWRIDTKLRGAGVEVDLWPAMKAGSFAAIGWPELGDLTDILASNSSKQQIATLLQQRYPAEAKLTQRAAAEIGNFGNRITENDVILASDGHRVVGVGRVKENAYRYDASSLADAPHRHAVEWVSDAEWVLPGSEGSQSTFSELRKPEEALIAAQRHLLETAGSQGAVPVTPPAGMPIRKLTRLEGGVPGKLQSILERKGQAILYGPPGTGKTHWARQAAQDLAAIAAFGSLFGDLDSEQKGTVTGTTTTAGLLRCCTFHPAYGYEDFIEGYRPRQGGAGQLIFEQRDGIFKRLCHDASASPERKFILLIDEINRGDIPRIFGELLTLLEKDKRGMEVTLPVSGDRFTVPHNVLVIGTMNTADRSIALLDTALRRRFGFVELMPNAATLAGAVLNDTIPLGLWLDSLNTRIREHLGKDARNLQIGHAYLLEGGKPVTDLAKFTRILAEDIVPLLEEYCYEDYGALTQILGEAMVDDSRQRVREELFAPAHQQDLIQALLAPTPDLSTSLEVTAQHSAASEGEEEADELAQ